MKTLILGTCYVAEAQEGAQNYGAKMVKLWLDLAKKLNPDSDILIVDSKSPVDVAKALGYPSDDPDDRRVMMHRLPDNVGHLNTTGVDGFGRALSVGINMAISGDYKYLAYMDCDIIFTRPIAPILNKMVTHGVKAACPMDTQYAFLENGIMFFEVAYLEATDFVGRYDWQSRKRTPDPLQIPEVVFEKLLDDVLFTLPLRGVRDDLNRLTVNNLEHMFPYGLDYLTHCRDFAVYERLLKMKGIEL